MSEKEVLRDFTELGKRFSFLVCIHCGVQSPPIIFERTMEVEQLLKTVGWKRLDTCPACLNEKETVKTGMA